MRPKRGSRPFGLARNIDRGSFVSIAVGGPIWQTIAPLLGSPVVPFCASCGLRVPTETSHKQKGYPYDSRLPGHLAHYTSWRASCRNCAQDLAFSSALPCQNTVEP